MRSTTNDGVIKLGCVLGEDVLITPQNKQSTLTARRGVEYKLVYVTSY